MRSVIVIIFLSIVIGLSAVLFPESMLISIGLVATYLMLNIASNYLFSRFDVFSPEITYSGVYLAYFFIGSLPLLGVDYLFKNGLYYLIGIVSFLLGGLYLKIIKVKMNELQINYHLLAMYGFSLFIVGLVFTVVIFVSYGVPMLEAENEIRHNVSSYFMYLALLNWLGTILFYASSIKLSKYRLTVHVMIGLSAFILFLLGYRTPLLTFLIILLLMRHYLIQRINIKKILIICLLLFIILGSFSYFRIVARDGTEVFQEKYGSVIKMNLLQPIIPALLTVQEGPKIFYELRGKVPDLQDFYYGKVISSSFLSILPGDNLSARQYVGLLTGTRYINGTLNTITPSVLGSLYVDFGLLGIIFGMFLTGALLQYYYKCLKVKRDVFSILIYSYLLVMNLNIIHSGFLDPIHIMFLLLIFFIRFLVTTRGG
ncbi:oligosaccharide repeat unit polymerase family protein [Radiobacillus kanasensis]|uniref:oligosaccharide repeat unit polymerase n=1 Tax=Radiobacillus kanasensis TaxID=2844358 RepID=UPI001E4B757A|nr:oligosaccharide repeat unit polymerase [Radiobacillus kanasensis]UFT98850.1 oligosaccharide repeat unit polymerase family protein [Radiobacillus kanasensis]